MVSKTQKAIEFLELVPDPHRNDILSIAEKVNSCERTVYRALYQLREKRHKLSEEHSFVKDLMSDVIFLVSFLEGKTTLKGELQAGDRVRLDSIGLLIDSFSKDIEFQEYIKLREVVEISQ